MSGTPASRGLRLKAATAFAAAAALSAALAGCVSTPSGNAPAALSVAPTVAITEPELVGNWGLASYRNEADRERTEAQAKAACNNPYKVTAGPNGGVLMYLADQNQLTELFVKTAPDGRVFIGPKGPPGVTADRAVLSFENGVLVTQWVDPSANERYGILVFVACAPKKTSSIQSWSSGGSHA
jgi:hypothetical protein